jgi:hypothetical protein
MNYSIKTFKTQRDYVKTGKYYLHTIHLRNLDEAKQVASQLSRICYKVCLTKYNDFIEIPFQE